MATLSYEDANIGIREDLIEAHRRTWRRIAEPGTWLDGPTRVAIAAESRKSFECGLCWRRKDALSPNAVDGVHDTLGDLPAPLVDIIHRVMTDPSRLSHAWFRSVIEAGLPDTNYVEAIGVACTTLAVDGFARGLGLPLRDLPEPVAGEPTRRRPVGAKQGPAWVPWVMPDDVTEAEKGLYDHGATNVCKAMSLVPETAIGFFDVVTAQYLPGITAIRDFGGKYRAINRAQIELLSARVSAINQCAYWTTSHAALLRASGEHDGEAIDLDVVLGKGEGDGGVEHGRLLVRFADAFVARDEAALAPVRREVLDALGEAGLVDSAACAAAYEGLDRVADSMGIPIDEERIEPTQGLREHLGVNDFASAANTRLK